MSKQNKNNILNDLTKVLHSIVTSAGKIKKMLIDCTNKHLDCPSHSEKDDRQKHKVSHKKPRKNVAHFKENKQQTPAAKSLKDTAVKKKRGRPPKNTAK